MPQLSKYGRQSRHSVLHKILDTLFFNYLNSTHLGISPCSTNAQVGDLVVQTPQFARINRRSGDRERGLRKPRRSQKYLHIPHTASGYEDAHMCRLSSCAVGVPWDGVNGRDSKNLGCISPGCQFTDRLPDALSLGRPAARTSPTGSWG